MSYNICDSLKDCQKPTTFQEVHRSGQKPQMLHVIVFMVKHNFRTLGNVALILASRWLDGRV